VTKISLLLCSQVYYPYCDCLMLGKHHSQEPDRGPRMCTD
jgi:hypothetical protein